jgi:hypothetical protein
MNNRRRRRRDKPGYDRGDAKSFNLTGMRP